MIWAVAFSVLAAAAAGVYLALSRDLLKMVIGISMLGSAANLAVFASGRLRSAAPPILEAGAEALGPAADPLPQALVLTAIVIGFSLTTFSIVLVLALQSRTGKSDAHRLDAAEPAPGADGKPALEED